MTVSLGVLTRRQYGPKFGNIAVASRRRSTSANGLGRLSPSPAITCRSSTLPNRRRWPPNCSTVLQPKSKLFLFLTRCRRPSCLRYRRTPFTKALFTIRIRGRHDQLAPWRTPSLFVNGSPDEAVNVHVCKRLRTLDGEPPISGAGSEEPHTTVRALRRAASLAHRLRHISVSSHEASRHRNAAFPNSW